jgi:integrase
VTDDLQPLDGREAIDLYLADRAPELRDATLESHEYRLTPFAEWVAEHDDLDDLRDVRGRHLAAFKRERQPDVAPNTLQSQMSTLRQFVRFLESVDAVRDGLAEKVRVPSVEQRARSTRVDRERAERILDHLGTYHYAGRQHALFALAWHSGLRIGGLRALDLDDLALDDDEQAHVQVRHRPETDTPLKNGADGERNVGLKEWCATILRDYVEDRRTQQTVAGDREPLFTTRHGRISEGWIRREFYQITGELLDNDMEKRPPHDVRRGAISDHLARGWPIDDLAERVNATPRVLRKHYDVRTEREAMLSRADLLAEEETA